MNLAAGSEHPATNINIKLSNTIKYILKSLITNFLEFLGDAYSGEKFPRLDGQSKCPYARFEGDGRENQGGRE